MLHVAEQPDGCWLWTAFRMANGYGFFRLSDRHELAHRTSYRLFIGELVDGLDVMHSCDNSGCVNPDHLSLGTRKENMAHAVAAGRMAVGEHHGRAKLSEPEVIAIRDAAGTQREIAAMFGVSQGHVSDIKRGTKWSYLAKEN